MKIIIALGFVVVSATALAASPPRTEPDTLSCRRTGAVCSNSQDCCSGHCTVQYGGRYHCGD